MTSASWVVWRVKGGKQEEFGTLAGPRHYLDKKPHPPRPRKKSAVNVDEPQTVLLLRAIGAAPDVIEEIGAKTLDGM